jgi:hypothetical protein
VGSGVLGGAGFALLGSWAGGFLGVLAVSGGAEVGERSGAVFGRERDAAGHLSPFVRTRRDILSNIDRTVKLIVGVCLVEYLGLPIESTAQVVWLSQVGHRRHAIASRDIFDTPTSN